MLVTRDNFDQPGGFSFVEKTCLSIVNLSIDQQLVCIHNCYPWNAMSARTSDYY